jgi:Ni/Co efflux regulator RcnB
MMRILAAIALSLAFGTAFAQTAGSGIQGDRQQIQKDKEKLRADKRKIKRDKRKLREDERKARARTKG